MAALLMPAYSHTHSFANSQTHTTGAQTAVEINYGAQTHTSFSETPVGRERAGLHVILADLRGGDGGEPRSTNK